MLVKTKEEFLQIKFPNLLALDTETTDLNPRKAKLEGIGFGDSKKQYYIDWETCDFQEVVIEKLKEVFKTKEIIFHNAKFDIEILKSILNLDYPVKIQDTLLMSWLLNENRQHGLKSLTKSLLKRKVVSYNEVPKQPNLFCNEKQLKEEMGKYCCADVKNTFDLYYRFLPELKEQKLDYDYYKIELPLIKILADMELRGVEINLKELKILEKKVEKIILEKTEILHKKLPKNLNIRSSKQLRDYLFKDLKIIPVKQTPKGEPSTDHESLKMLAKQNKAVQIILDFREYDKLQSVYIKGLQEKAEHGILHTNFLQHGTRTGRLSSSHPNLQNIPARIDEYDVRKYFVPRKGYKFITSDFSQIELRVVAFFSQEEAMLKIFQGGGDIHQLTADMVGCSRRHAKAINFGLIYGLGPRNLAKDLEISEAQAIVYMQTFFQKYPKLTSYIGQVQAIGLYNGYVTTLTNRRRRFPLSKSMTRGDIEAIKRRIINTKIQGTMADLMKVAMIKIYNSLKNYDAHILLQIHDEVIVEVKENQVEKVSELVKKAMESSVKFNIPIPADLKITDCWVK